MFAVKSSFQADSCISLPHDRYPPVPLPYSQSQTPYSQDTPCWVPYFSTASSSPPTSMPRGSSSDDVTSNGHLSLTGPVEVKGSVISGRGITFQGYIQVKKRVEAYGDVDISGDTVCHETLKAYGNVTINGSLSSNVLKSFGNLRINGSVEADEVEVYGTVTIQGSLQCRKLKIYNSLTLVGETSYYFAVDETILGRTLSRESGSGW